MKNKSRTRTRRRARGVTSRRRSLSTREEITDAEIARRRRRRERERMPEPEHEIQYRRRHPERFGEGREFESSEYHPAYGGYETEPGTRRRRRGREVISRIPAETPHYYDETTWPEWPEHEPVYTGGTSGLGRFRNKYRRERINSSRSLNQENW